MDQTQAPPSKHFNAQRIQEVLFYDLEKKKWNPELKDWADELWTARARRYGGRIAAESYRSESVTSEEQTTSITVEIPKLRGYFIGRDDDLKAVLAMLPPEPDSVAILVQGAPGMGKTELTKAVAHDESVAKRFRERRWFVPLEKATTAELMRRAIILAIGSDPDQGFQGALETLRGKQTLLILDNLETPWEPVGQRDETKATLVGLHAVPGVTLIASFRGADFVGGPLWKGHRVEALPSAAATKLFATIVEKWVLDDPKLSDFINELGGIPLAIDLVARRAHGFRSLSWLWEEWQRVGAELAQELDVRMDRLTSLHHSIEITLRSTRMSEKALQLFAILGRLPAGIRCDAVKVILGSKLYFEAVDRLCKSGIAYEVSGRLALLPPIREHALRHYRPVDNEWIGRYIKTIGDLALDRSRHSLDISREGENIDAVILNCVDEINLSKLSDLISALSTINYFGLYFSSLIDELPLLFKSSRDTLSEAHCLAIAGRMGLGFDICYAEGKLREAYDTYLQIGNHRGRANCLLDLAYACLRTGKCELASAYCDESISIFEEMVCIRGLAKAHESRGSCYYQCSNLAYAEAHWIGAEQYYLQDNDEAGSLRCRLAVKRHIRL